MKGAPFLEPPQADPTSLWQLFASVIFLIALVELFLLASYEATFVLLSRSSLEKLVENGVERASAMLKIYEPRHRLRLMARLGEALGVITCALSLLYIVGPIYTSYGLPNYYGFITAFLGTLFAAFLVLSTPRRLRFDDDGEEMSIAILALAFVPLHALLSPFTLVLDRITSGDYSDEDFRAEKEEELRSIVESEGESGVIEESEREMIQGVFGFHDRIVREVMVPRVDMIAIEQSSSVQDLLALIKDKGHSRLPIYKDSLDSILGLVYAKDLLQLLVGRREIDVQTPLVDLIGSASGTMGDVEFIHPPYYVPETKKIDALLNDMRSNRTRLAIVLDEYSGTAGIVTTEDLVEEIVGEIQDEYDDDEELYQWQMPGEVLLANARIDIDDLNELFNSNLPSDGFETLGGFIFDHLGQIPEEMQNFQAESIDFTILKVDGQRIAQVRLKRLEQATSTNTEVKGLRN
ncbi:MAG: putative hemolysin [Candidatus Latescibacterota bacterium]|jgi:putative hemolysin